ncbi:hypothetical protein [Haliangium ochraceum]|uniref:Lipoprotein n=1 Tax=Haliangium ochraceum (strain DSM 14365 / JCM 11303 / SMP-2) TaxID=502025 RepID=D0LN87_HALO1|nr:hypothetical protein [Haliangium ochraceum]ACY15264.1 hypothetical protein Hoch_2735 [Haliangium ochraceum DSM 14365]
MRILLLALAIVAFVGCYNAIKMSCTEHYVACQDTVLGSVRDGYQSRCDVCRPYCQGQSDWPRETPAGGTCEYWRYRGGPFATDAGGHQ